MKGFWANEWDLFLKDLDNIADFFMQPVTFSEFSKKNDQMLRPSKEEAEAKSETSSFWANEWNLFLNDLDRAADFLFQDIKFK